MPKIIAWQCPHTEKVFIDFSEYQKHLKKLARERRADRILQKKAEARLAIFAEMRETCSTAEEIQKFFVEHAELFWINAAEYAGRTWGEKAKKLPEGFACKSVSFSGSFNELVSNTHSCPKNGVQNWHYKDDLPRGYPGFQGTIRFSFTHETPGFCSGMFEDTGIITGSGGGGAMNARYELKLYLDDWPALKRRVEAEKDQYEKEHMLHQIKNSSNHFKKFRIAL
jgi:hypothetical protein